MVDSNDGTSGGEGGGNPGEGRREWPADLRIAFAQLLVEFKELEGRMNTTEARFERTVERLGTRLTVIIMAAAGLIMTGLGVSVAVLALLGAK